MEAGIPDKIFFKIGEVAALASLRPSVLRYWETEFSILKPTKSRSGQRLYSRQNVELVLEIKRLLYSEKLTIEGARKRIRVAKQGRSTEDADSESRLSSVLREVRNELRQIRDSLQQ
jgi:DNA-binding transcriptional MerR regulator